MHTTGRSCKTFIVIFFLFHLSKGFAQDTISSATVEQKSYQLYLDKNWDELIKFGNAAVDKGYDYFYLQMRIGIAWYEKKNYRVAEDHFLNALTYNSGDELAQEYLYYCYMFAGKYDEARVFSIGLSNELAHKLGTDSLSTLSFVVVEGGSKLSDSASYYDKNKKAYATYFNPAVYFQVGFGHYVKNRISLFHALTYYNQKDFRGHSIQFQYYLNANIPLKGKWSVSPAVHWLNKDYTPNIPAKPIPPPHPGMPPPKNQAPQSTRNNYFVGSLEIKKSISRFDLTLGTTVSNIDSADQYIHYFTLKYFPFGNDRLSIAGTYILHTENTYSSFNSGGSFSVVVRPTKRLAITGSYLYNQTANIIESNGYIVNNSADFTPSRYALMAAYTFGKHFNLYGLYQFENKTETIQKLNYYYNVIVVGFKIIP